MAVDSSKWGDLDKLVELAGELHRGDYNFTPDEVRYGTTEPWPALPCRCEGPGFAYDSEANEQRCWKCGACP